MAHARLAQGNEGAFEGAFSPPFAYASPTDRRNGSATRVCSTVVGERRAFGEQKYYFANLPKAHS
jgi:hypothetical protein